MELKDAILTLRGYNAWRRGGENYTQPDPRVIGDAIDAVGDGYEALLRERDAAREAFAVATSNCVAAQQRLREMERLERERDEAREQLNIEVTRGGAKPRS